MNQVGEESVTAVAVPCPVCSHSCLLQNLNRRFSALKLDEQREHMCDRCHLVGELAKTCLANGIIVPRESSALAIEWEFEHQNLSTPRWSNLIVTSNGHILWGSSFEAFALPGHPKPFPDIPEKELHGDTSSEENLARVRDWLKACQESHACLQQPTDNPPLPARVLDIRNSPVRLYRTQGARGQYICLSHCWGATRPACRTTMATLETNVQGIPWDTLPATFRDAIHYTRRLGFDFLWIDSICIIQDNETDWAEQAAQMADIYENAHLTLCATASADDDGGLHGQTPPELLPQEILISRRDGTAYTMYVRAELADRHLPLPGSLGGFTWEDTRSTHVPLLTRAWVLQERLLSRRLLHFAWGELLWECSELAACGCFQGIGQHIYQPSLATEPLNKGLFKEYLAPPPSSAKVLRHWNKIVQAFTGMHLSHARDKLPALSGIARQTLRQLRPGDQYLAGLWRNTLLSDLCWTSVTDSVTHRGRSPTWSWASIDGRVRCMDDVRPASFITSVIDANVRSAGPDPTGEVISGHIILDALHCHGRLKVEPDSGENGMVCWVGYGPGPDIEFYLDSPDLLRDGVLANGDDIVSLVLGFYKGNFPFCMVLRKCQRAVDEDGIPLFERVGSMGRGPTFMQINRFLKGPVKIV